MQLKAKITLLLILLLTLSCQQEIKRWDDLYFELATVDNSASTLRFRLDNQQLLIPQSRNGYNGQSGQRVILNYTPLRGDTIKVNQVVDIFTGTVKEHAQPTLNHDRIWLQSTWVSGGYLNMIIEVEYLEGGHHMELTRNKDTAPGDLYFFYSREDDPPGYRQKMYLSFSLETLLEDEEPIDTIQLHLHTHEGIRVMRLQNR